MAVVFVTHQRLVIADLDSDGTTVVFCPPGLEAEKILAVASVVLPAQRYQELADQLAQPPTQWRP